MPVVEEKSNPDRVEICLTVEAKSSGTPTESSETSSATSVFSSERTKTSSERILDLIKQNPSISAAEIAMLIEMSSRGVEKQIKKLREEGIIRRKGADFGGYWEIVKDKD